MHPRSQERDFSIRLSRAMAIAANHFMTTKEFEAFDECCKISARAVNEGITEAELIELESFVSQRTGISIQVPAGEVFGVKLKVVEDNVIEAAWPSN
ncbi:hypothetical protein [Ectopseudomonas khazarica]|uniref:hypothetical protein n=1 Tax=Ectopseudomonas khazarica TaxID=2502979 RepID=UPI00106DEB10|nr:hypothetical protein [Pseudomonas khazarica]